MARWLTTIFVVITLASGLLAGEPLRKSSGKMMSCCDKARSKDNSPSARAASLCCALNCSETVPTQSGGVYNYSPSGVTIVSLIVDLPDILFPKKHYPAGDLSHSLISLPQTFQPKYIQHKSLLI